ncbi:MAG TPA: serine/threonine-protein kinase [Actinoplanes sp.]|nr:serine/threonine-protein kinase [Actinoplanes sp.]
MPVSPLRSHDPRHLGEYTLLGVLGEGGMGAVYQGRSRDGRLVAVKMIRTEFATVDEFRNRFRSEVNRARQVPSFSTAAVLDADPDHNPPYLVVEYVDGPDLAQVVAENGPLRDGALHSVAVGVATALAAIHGAGVVHRDLKPRNVLFALGAPKVIDFGIARATESTSEHTRTGQMVGTVAYMAPERLDGPVSAVTPAVDIFAWGAVVAYAANGRSPFHGDSSTAIAVRILTREPELGSLTGPLRTIVERALSKDPAHRPTASELLQSLLNAGQDPAPVVSTPPKPRRRVSRIVLATAAASVLAAAAAIPIRMAADNGPETTTPQPSAAPILTDPLTAPASWKASKNAEGGDCRYEDNLRVTSVSSDGYFCPGPEQTLPGTHTITFTLDSVAAGSCAVARFRHGDADLYEASFCEYDFALTTNSATAQFQNILETGRGPREITIRVRDNTVRVWIGDLEMLSTPSSFEGTPAGRLDLGVEPASYNDETASAAYSKVEIWAR